MRERLSLLVSINVAMRIALLLCISAWLTGCQFPQIALFHQFRSMVLIKLANNDCENVRYERAEKLAREAVDEARLCPLDSVFLPRILQSLAYILNCQERYYEAVPVFQEALTVAKQNKARNNSFIANLHRLISGSYAGEGLYEKALTSIKDAMAIDETLVDKSIGDILEDKSKLADIQFQLGRYKESIESYREILGKSNAKATDKTLLAKCSYRLGHILEKLGQIEEAEKAYQQSTSLAEKSSDKKCLATSSYELGMFYERSNDHAKAATYCGRSLKLREEILVDDSQKSNSGRKLELITQLGPGKRNDFILTLETAQLDQNQDQRSETILAALNRGLSLMPPKVIKVLARSGCRIVIVPLLSETSSRLKNSQPAGYHDGASFDSAGGVNATKYNMVLIPRKRSSRLPWPHNLEDNYRIPEFICHELGHALDDYLGPFSDSDSFKQCYREDKIKLSLSQKRPLHYYLQNGHRGRRETFAELFNVSCGGACKKRSSKLPSLFPKTNVLLKEELSKRGLITQ